MVGEVGVHDDDEVARRKLQAVHVRSSQTQLAGAGADLDMLWCVHPLELRGDLLRSVRRAVVDNDELPVQLAVGRAVLAVNCSLLLASAEGLQGYLLLSERLVEQPCYYGQIAALIVCGEQDRVLVLLLRNGSHLVCGGDWGNE